MENEDYDDISQVKFRHIRPKDKDSQAANDNLFMKYFGSKLNNNPVQREKYTEENKQLTFTKPAVLSAIVTALMVASRSSLVENFFSFTSKEYINQLILYGGFFVLSFLVIYIAYQT